MRNPARFTAKRKMMEKLEVDQTEWDLRKFIAFLRGDLKSEWTKAMYPLINEGQPVQWGALGEPFDEVELNSGWALKALPIIGQLKHPIRISTKGGKTILRDEYLDAFKEARPYVWVNFSIIHPEDDVMRKIDLRAPEPSVRFKAMKALSDMGIKTGLRYRPIVPQLALKDVKGEPAWKVMVDNAVEAGAKAISYEVIFLNQSANEMQRKLYQRLSDVVGVKDFPRIWKHHSIRNQNCLRANRLYKYGLMMNIHDYAKSQGLYVGVSDPHFKEYGDSPCCCGIPEDDQIFGKFSRKCLTSIVIAGRKAYEEKGENLRFHFTDWAPDWAKEVPLHMMVCLSDADKHHKYAKTTWYDKLRNSWNKPTHFRSPYYYFEGILEPVEIDSEKDVVYEYRHWEGQVFKDVERLAKLRKEPSLLSEPHNVDLREELW
jgi:DNA repair photolyase